MLTLIRTIGVACFALLFAVGLAHAVDIDLTNSDGTKTKLQSNDAGAAKISNADQTGGEHIGENQNEELGYVRTVGGKARSYALMTDVTTDTSSATTILPVGGKTFFAKIVGSSGAQSVTVTIWGDYKSTATEEFLICTMTLSGTSEDAKKCTGITEDYDFYHAKTASILGTGATVNVWSMMGLGGGAGAAGGGDASAANQTTEITSLQLIDNLAQSDLCASTAKTFIPFSIATATTTELTPSLAGASNYYHVCSFVVFPTAAANTIALVDDDTDGCASVTSGLAGGITAGTGGAFAANGGIVMGTGGNTIAKTNGTNRVICLVTGSAVQTSGVISVVAGP